MAEQQRSKAALRHGQLYRLSCLASRARARVDADLMATRDLGVDEALAMVRAQRPFVQPNPAFMRRLSELEGDIRAIGRAE